MEEVLDLPLPEAADGAAPKAQSVPDENQILSHVPHFDKRERVASVSVLHSAPLPLGYEKHNETRGLYPVFAEHFELPRRSPAARSVEGRRVWGRTCTPPDRFRGIEGQGDRHRWGSGRRPKGTSDGIQQSRLWSRSC